VQVKSPPQHIGSTDGVLDVLSVVGIGPKEEGSDDVGRKAIGAFSREGEAWDDRLGGCVGEASER